MKTDPCEMSETQMLDASGIGIVILDKNYVIVQANRAFEEIAGRELASISLWDIIADKLDKFRIAGDSTSQSEQTARCHELCLTRPDGARRHVQATFLPSGENIRMVAYDITRYRELERRLLHAEKLMSMGEMTAGIAHELKNYLTLISTQVQLLDRAFGGNDPDLDKHLDNIGANVDRTFRLVTGLVDFSRPDLEAPAPCNLNDVFEAAVGLCEFQMRKANIKVELDLSRELPAIVCRQGQIEQIIINLLVNAIQAMGTTGGVLSISTSVVDDEHVRWVIKDEGCGIAPEHLQKIFEPFFTTKPHGKGSGLGLTIVSKLLEEHNADLQVDSQPGLGTTVSVTIPVRQ